jgi:hypothetical protein
VKGERDTRDSVAKAMSVEKERNGYPGAKPSGGATCPTLLKGSRGEVGSAGKNMA